MQAPGSTLVPLLVFVPILVWRLYSRARRSIGRQTLSRVRPWITVTVFPLLIVLFSFSAMTHLERLVWLAGAVCIGAALGVFGISKTKFENTAQGLYYTPNAHLGIALSALLAARVIYRMVQVYSMGPAQPTMSDFSQSPLTLAVFGLLAGYYVAYAIGLIRWRQRVTRAVPA
jgi:membrane protein CcdC involved in cytochrome C biogenesis